MRRIQGGPEATQPGDLKHPMEGQGPGNVQKDAAGNLVTPEMQEKHKSPESLPEKEPGTFRAAAADAGQLPGGPADPGQSPNTPSDAGQAPNAPIFAKLPDELSAALSDVQRLPPEQRPAAVAELHQKWGKTLSQNVYVDGNGVRVTNADGFTWDLRYREP
jgi:hypothetical protein